MYVLLKRSVFVGFVLLALVPVTHAACWLAKIEPGVTHCQDVKDKTWHPVGSNWKNSNCDQCECSPFDHSCCNGWPTGTSKDCTIKYDYATCTYEIINQKIPGGPCPAVGK
ncbi:beta-microseminoprotein-like [Neoarius graeffei]|uniref:beta-microseminoprotein-like n=1 Tax=Neoarius graeffei TaxID=443677 RepID=UPI00298CF11D|nr:beta-microseminoprotein-like [Neoarius graeffei]